MNDGAGRGVLVAGLGSFGGAVASRLVALHHDRILVEWQHFADALSPGMLAAVVAMSTPSPRASALIDLAAFRAKVPWLPVVRDVPQIRVGPLVVPGIGPCHRCFEKRRRQHESGWSAMRGFEWAQERHQISGPDECLPHHVSLASGLAEHMIQTVVTQAVLEPVHPLAGVVVVADLTSRAMTSGTVTSHHGCARCGYGSGAQGPVRDL